MSTQPATIHDLLVHADFLRRVVRDLVADEATREDLTQEVWLQALRAPPREAGGIRGWMATTARNLLSNKRRSSARRAAREEFVGAGDPAPDVAEILEREGVRESVLRAVLALDEPFRGAVLLRYYEGLAPHEIAARLGVPAATVRSRLARGLDRLKARLDDEHGDRRTWVLAALPLGRPGATDALSAPLGLAPIASGLALILGGAALWFAFGGDDGDASTTIAATARTDAEVRADAEASPHALSAPTDPKRAPAAAAGPARTEPALGRRLYAADRGRGSIHGVVVDAFDAPLPGLRVRAQMHAGGVPPGLVVEEDRAPVADVVTDDAGRFRFVDVEAGPVRVEARFPDGRAAERGIVLGAGEDAGPVRLAAGDARPTRGERFHVLVVDARGEPVAGAEVGVWAWSRDERDPARTDRSASEAADRASTDAAGRATFRADLDDGVVLATAPDGRAGWRGFRNPHDERRPLRVVVEATGTLAGTIVGVEADELVGAHLSLFALSSLEPYFSVGGRRIDVPLAGATFEARGLAAGTYALVLTAPGGATLVHPPLLASGHALANSATHVTATVKAGATAEVALAAQRGAVVQGRVLSGGAPVAGARVRAVRPPRTSNFTAGFVLHGVHVWRFDGGADQAAFAPIGHVVARTDADGRYRIPSLVPGLWRIEVAMDGLAFDRREALELRAEEPVELVHELAPAGVLQVGSLDATYLGVYAPDAAAPTMLAVVRDGCGTFAGLAAGTWRIALMQADESVPPRFVADARVEAGRLTWVDLRRADGEQRPALRGSVRANGVPVADAVVELGAASARTDAAGRYELRLAPTAGTPTWDALPLLVRVGSAQHVIGLGGDADPRVVPVDVDLTGRTLAIDVRDERGDPARAQIDVLWMPVAPELVGRRGATLTAARADGRFEFAAIDAGSLEGNVTFADGWIGTIAGSVPADGVLAVRRPPSGTLTVRVLAGGGPVAERKVHLASTSGTTRWNLTLATDARGTVEVAAPSGAIEAWTSAGFGARSARGAADLSIGGAAEIVLQLPE